MGILKLIHVCSRNGYFETHSCLYFETLNPNLNSICQTLEPKSTKSPNPQTIIVRLNLFNHVLALFRAKFACILAIRYLVFRWESCKSCVWECVKKTQDVCKSKESRDWISQLASHQSGTCVKHVGNWRVTTIGALQDKNIQSGQAVSSQLKLVTHSSRKVESPECPIWMKPDFSHFYTLL